ncbi:PepSY-associated TM helix domain-containing protein [Vibrio paucivorans]
MLNQSTQKEADSAKNAAQSAKTLYFLTWRWHFYAGLFVVPFMLMLSLTGLVMLFDDEIEFARYGDVIEVTPQIAQVTPSAQLDAVQSAYPDASVTQFITAPSSTTANRFSVTKSNGETVLVTVDPYTGRVLGEIDRSESWYQLANDIHGTLLVGETGDFLIEMAASLTILLLVSGIYMWLPTDRASAAGFLKVRLQNGSRTLLRDLHTNIGGVLSLVLLFFVLSGLAWAGIWGAKFVQPWNTFPAQKWDDVPLSSLTHKDLNHGSEEEMPWNLEQTPVPESHDHSAMMESGEVFMDNIGINAVVAKAETMGFTRYRINFPRSETGVFTVSANTMSGDISDPTQDRTSHVDQYSGELLADVTWQNYSLIAKAMAAGIALHQGDISVVNKAANALICVLFIVISVTGVLMWWMRRPSGVGKVGVPPRFERDSIWKTGALTLVVIAIAFPLAGISIIVAMLIDWLLIRRVAKLRLALS